MTGAIFLAPVTALGVACGALAWAHVRRVLEAVREDTEALSLRLKRVPADERLATLRDLREPGQWEHELAVDVLAAPDEDARVAAVNLALADVEHALERGARWPMTALRIALLGGALLAYLARVVDPDQLRWTLAVGAVAGLAALTCAQASRTAERQVEHRRRAVDALVAAALALPPAGPCPPSPLGGAGGASARRRRRAGS